MNRRDLEMLLQDLFDGRLEREAFELLQEELRSDPAAREAYRDYLHLHHALRFRNKGVDLLNVVPMDRVIERRQRRYLRTAGLAAAAALALAAVVMSLILTSTPSPILRFVTSPGTDLTMSHQLTREEAPEGQVMERGSQLTLRRGTVELDFASGIRGIVRAPAELILRDEDLLELERGTAWFEVSPKAVGFMVATPDLVLTDLGTEFGIRSRPESLDEVHVFTGKVEVLNRYGLKKRELVAAGRARLAGPAGRWHDIPLRRDHFLAELPAAEPQPVRAAPFSWETATSVSAVGDTIISTEGSLVEAINFGESTDRVVNTVRFDGHPTGSNSPTSDFSELTRGVRGTAFRALYVDGGIGAAFEGMMDSMACPMDRSPIIEKVTLTLKNLTIGDDYLVQLLVSDDRTTDLQDDEQTYTGDTGVSGPHQCGLSYSLIGRFTANTATQTINVVRGGTVPREPSLNGYQLRKMSPGGGDDHGG